MQANDSALRGPLPVRMVRDLAANRGLIGQFAWRDAVLRYKGSYLGIVWSFIVPLMMLAVYTLVFGVIFKNRWGGDQGTGADFILNLFCGLIMFNVFAECVQRASDLILANPNYVKRVIFPLQILPAAALGSSLINAAFGLAILLPATIFVQHRVSPTLWMFPLTLLPLCALTLGFGWALASLGVFVRDLTQPVMIATQALFFLSGIFFPLSAVPPYLRKVMLLNPLTTILDTARRTLLWGMPPMWSWWLPVTAGSLVVMLLGYYAFMHSKKAFADVM
jgi:lipopolysaccharide transport system permease protein